MAFDYEGALNAGYSDEEISDYLSKKYEYDIEGALNSGYSHAEINQYLIGKEPQETKSERSWYTPAVEFGKNLVRTHQSAIGGIGSLLEYGSKYAQKAGKAIGIDTDPITGYTEAMGKEIRDYYGKAQEDLAPRVGSFTEIKGLGDAVDYLAAGLGSLTSTVSLIAAFGGFGTAPRAAGIAPKAAQGIGRVMQFLKPQMMDAPIGVMEFGEIAGKQLEEQEESGKDLSLSRLVTTGALATLVERSVGVEPMLNKFFNMPKDMKAKVVQEGAKGIFGQGIKRVLKGMGVTGAEEGLEEGIQTVLEIYGGNPEKLFTKESAVEIVDGIIQGMFGGMVLGGGAAYKAPSTKQEIDNIQRVQRQILTNPTDVENDDFEDYQNTRYKMAEAVGGVVKEYDKDLAKSWDIYTKSQIDKNLPINLGMIESTGAFDIDDLTEEPKAKEEDIAKGIENIVSSDGDVATKIDNIADTFDKTVATGEAYTTQEEEEQKPSPTMTVEEDLEVGETKDIGKEEITSTEEPEAIQEEKATQGELPIEKEEVKPKEEEIEAKEGEELEKEPEEAKTETVEEKVETPPVEAKEEKAIEFNKKQLDIIAELSASEAGKRIAIRDESGETRSARIASTFPKWIPSELRKRKLIDVALGHISNGTAPTRGKNIKALYQIVKDKIDAAAKVAEAIERTGAHEKIPTVEELREARKKPEQGELVETPFTLSPQEKEGRRIIEERSKGEEKREAEEAEKAEKELNKRAELFKEEEEDVPLFMVANLVHGSGKLFDRFSTKFVGTGEGAQFFSWGLYFTSLEDIGRYYARTIANKMGGEINYEIGEKKVSKEILDRFGDILKKLVYQPKEEVLKSPESLKRTFTWLLEDAEPKDVDKFKQYIKKAEEDIEFINSIKEPVRIVRGDRYLYKVTLHKGKDPSEYRFMDWYKPIGKDIAKIIEEAISEDVLNAEEYKKDNFAEDWTGQHAYKVLVNRVHYYVPPDNKELLRNPEKAASLYLLSKGIDGVRYPAESLSRGIKKKPRGYNYVVFDENAVTIEDVTGFSRTNPASTTHSPLVFANNKDIGRVQKWANKFHKIMGLAGIKFKVIPNQDAVPEGVKRHIKKGDQVFAFYYRGTIYYNANAFGNELDLRQAALHEYIHVAGLLNILKEHEPDFYQKAIQALDDHAKKHDDMWKKIIKDNKFDLDDPTHLERAREELLARIAEGQPKSGLMFRIKQAIRKILRKFGINDRYTDHDIIQTLIQGSMMQARMMSEWNKMQEEMPSFLKETQKEAPPYTASSTSIQTWIQDTSKAVMWAITKNYKKEDGMEHISAFQRVFNNPLWYTNKWFKKLFDTGFYRMSEMYHEYVHDYNNIADQNVTKLTKEFKKKQSHQYRLLGHLVTYIDENRDKFVLKPDDKIEVIYERIEKFLRDKHINDEGIKIWKLRRMSYDKMLDDMLAQINEATSTIFESETSTGNLIKELEEMVKESKKYSDSFKKKLNDFLKTEDDESTNAILNDLLSVLDAQPQVELAKEIAERLKVKRVQRNLKEAINSMGRLRGTYEIRHREHGKYNVSAQRMENGKLIRYFKMGNKVEIGQLASQLEREGWKGVTISETKTLSEEIYLNMKNIDVANAIQYATQKMELTEDKRQFLSELLTTTANMIKERGSRRVQIKRGEDIVRGYETDLIKRHVRAMTLTASGLSKSQGMRDMYNIVLGMSYEDIIKNAVVVQQDGELMKKVGDKWVMKFKAYEGDFALADTFIFQLEFDKKPTDEDVMKVKMQYYKDNYDGKTTGIQEKDNKNDYKAAMAYIKEVGRNLDIIDRLVNMGKSIATLKYLGANVRSPLVNITAVATSAPASIHFVAGDGKVSMWKVVRTLAKAMNAYTQHMFGKKVSDTKLQGLMDEITKSGWDMPQLTREVTNSVQGKFDSVWSNILGASMKLFALTEQWNRGVTMVAAHIVAEDRLQKEGLTPKDDTYKQKAWELARDATTKAHAGYGKANMPEAMEGTGVGQRAAQMMYIYGQFGHNYVQLLLRTGTGKKKDVVAFLWALLSPIIIAGGAAFPFKDNIIDIFNYMLRFFGIKTGVDKFVWDGVRKHLGEKAEIVGRRGLAGGLGLDVAGSLAVGADLPSDILDIGGAFGGVVRDVQKAIHYAGAGQPIRAVEKMSPTVISNIARAVREGKAGYTTERGAVIWDKDGRPMTPSKADTAKRVLGFTSPKLTVAKEAKREATELELTYRDMRTDIYEQIRSYATKKTKDPKEWNRIHKQILDYNKEVVKNNLRPEVSLITFQTIRSQIKGVTMPAKKEMARLQR